MNKEKPCSTAKLPYKIKDFYKNTWQIGIICYNTRVSSIFGLHPKGWGPVAKDMTLAVLFDLYGEVLSPRQREIFSGYYNDDCSLSELATDFGITRQGALQAIQTAEHKLREWDEKLGFFSILMSTRRLAGEIVETAKSLPQNEEAKTIIALAKEIETL